MGDTGYVGEVTKWRRKPSRRDTMYDAVGYVRQSARRNRLFNLAQGTKSISGDEKKTGNKTPDMICDETVRGVRRILVGGSVPPCCLRRRKF